MTSRPGVSFLRAFARRMRRRPSRRLVAWTAAIAVVLELAALAGWWAHDDWRRGRVVLDSNELPLRVQVFDESGDSPIGEPVDVVGERTLSLPAGDYRLRVEGDGLLGRTFRMAVVRGETLERELSLDEGRLLGGEIRQRGGTRFPPPDGVIPFAEITTAVELTPGRSSLVERNNQSFVLRDGDRGAVLWDFLRVPETSALGRQRLARLRTMSWRLRQNQPIRPAPDLNGDGVRDLLWPFPDEPAFLAVSGKDGSVLWTRRAELDGPGTFYPDHPGRPNPEEPASRAGRVLGVPRTADLDRDGLPDVLAVLSFAEFPDTAARRAARPNARRPAGATELHRRVVIALSGRTGERLWTHAFDPDFKDIPWNAPDVQVEHLAGREPPLVTVADGSTWHGVDARTGRLAAGPIDLGIASAVRVQHAQLVGDAEPEIVVVGPGQQDLSAFRIGSDRPLWKVGMKIAMTSEVGRFPRVWPICLDLDGDGLAELVVPDRSPPGAVNNFLSLRVLDGSTGRARWTHALQLDTSFPGGLRDVLAAPDLDGDGVLDLIATSTHGGRPNSSQSPFVGDEWLYVDALSGKDGRSLWSWRDEIVRQGSTMTYSPPVWWGRGPDGWPLLAVSPVTEVRPAVGSVWSGPGPPLRLSASPMLEASTGRLVQTLRGWDIVRADDLNGDGVLDLWGRYKSKLRAIRGQTPEAWRTLEYQAVPPVPRVAYWDESLPAPDLDGDGFPDVLTCDVQAPSSVEGVHVGSRTAIARSGRDGRLLWAAPLDVRAGWFDRGRHEVYAMTALPLPAGDLDGDAAPEILVREEPRVSPSRSERLPATYPLAALSGRTGRTLWVAGPMPLPFRAHGFTMVTSVEPRFVEAAGRPDLLVRHRSPFVAPVSFPATPPIAGAGEDRMARISGRSGEVVWDVVLGRTTIGPQTYDPVPPRFVDLDGDGVDEVVAIAGGPAGPSGQSESIVIALSALDGRVLWSRPLGTPFPGQKQLQVLEIEEGRRRAIVVADANTVTGPNQPGINVWTLDGRDGRLLWWWPNEEHGLFGNRGLTIQTVRLDASGSNGLCIGYLDPRGPYVVIVLDDRGRQCTPGPALDVERFFGRHSLRPHVVDLDGDGHEEFVIQSDGVLRALGREGERLWSRPYPGSALGFLPPAGERPVTLVLPSSLFLDGKTGRPVWSAFSGGASLWTLPPVLEARDGAGPPHILEHWLGSTIVRWAVAAMPDGRASPAKGTLTPPGLALNDPRWLRPLPWVDPMLHDIRVGGLLLALALAFVNVALPVGVLWLFARRRRWSIRLLMLVPIAVAVPLWVFQTVEPMIPAQIAGRPISPRIIFVVATLAGLPGILFAGSVARNLACRRWRVLAWRVGVTALAAAIMAAVWIRDDLRFMSVLERYDPSGWPLALLLGAMAAGALIPFGWLLRKVVRWPRPTEAAR